MSQVTLAAQTGRATGSAASRRLRGEDQIPGVIYGQGMTPISLSVNRRELRLALQNPAGFNTLLSLDVDGKKYPAVIKTIQRHPIRRNISHLDFLQVSMTEAITVNIPVRLEGEAKAVMSEGGMVDAAVDTIEVSCNPGDMPNEIVIDITAMQPGDTIRLSDITLPKGVTATGDAEMPIVTALAQMSDEPGDAAPEADAAAE